MSVISAAAQEAGRLIYAASETCADLAYCSGFFAPDPFLWYETSRERGLIVSVLELGRARKEAREGTRVRSIEEVRRAWALPAGQRAPEVLIAALARETGVRCWSVPEGFPLGLARKLGRRRLRLQTQSSFCPERERKTPGEVERVREGVRLAEAGPDRAQAVLRQASIGRDGLLRWQGRTLEADTLRGEIVSTIARLGGTASRPSPRPGPTAPTPRPGSGPIPAHVPIVIDTSPESTAPATSGTSPDRGQGPGPETVRQAFAAVQGAQEAAPRGALPPGSWEGHPRPSLSKRCRFLRRMQADPREASSTVWGMVWV